MKITLKMNETNTYLTFNMTMNGARIYRQNFSRDMLKDMNEIYGKLHKSPFDGIDMGGIQVEGKTDQEIYEQILSKVDVTKVLAVQNKETLDFDETERGAQIIWAFAKNADKDTPDYDDWFESFDYILPVGEIIVALYEAWHKSAMPTIEIKN